jgi:hypothetical protein
VALASKELAQHRPGASGLGTPLSGHGREVIRSWTFSFTESGERLVSHDDSKEAP